MASQFKQLKKEKAEKFVTLYQTDKSLSKDMTNEKTKNLLLICILSVAIYMYIYIYTEINKVNYIK
jgi:hypothetical protein